MAPLSKSLSLGAWSESDECRSDAFSDYQAPPSPTRPSDPPSPKSRAASKEVPPTAAVPKPKTKPARRKINIVWTEITPHEEIVILPYLNDDKATLEQRVERLDERAHLALRTNVNLEARIVEEDHQLADLRVELDCRQDEWTNLQGLMQERKTEYEEAQAQLTRLREQRVSEEKRLRERHLALSERLSQLTKEWHCLVRGQAEEDRNIRQNREVFQDLRAQVRSLEQRKADFEFGDDSVTPADSPTTRLFDHVVASGPAQLTSVPPVPKKDPSAFGSSNASIDEDRASCTYSASALGEPERGYSTFGDRGYSTIGEGDVIDEGVGASARSSTAGEAALGAAPRRSTSQSPKPPPEPRVGTARPPLHRSSSYQSQ